MRVLLGRTSFLTVMLLFLLSMGGLAQTQGNASIDDIIARAAEQRKAYINEFKNLMSQETKTFEIFDKKGEVKKRRSVVSTFIVYQLSKDDRSIAEYRNVVSVDGKKLKDADKRAEDFFEQIAKVESSSKELEKLEREGSRFDEEISLNLFTLYQAAPLAENIRPSLAFRLQREDSVLGRRVYVVSYSQTKKSPYILTDGEREIGDGKLALKYETGLDDKAAAIRLNGEFWIDALTFQVQREKRTLTVLPEGWNAPVVIAETIFDYAGSDFGILIPKRIEHTQLDIRKKERISVKNSKITFEYDKFTRPDVEVKSSEVK